MQWSKANSFWAGLMWGVLAVGLLQVIRFFLGVWTLERRCERIEAQLRDLHYRLDKRENP